MTRTAQRRLRRPLRSSLAMLSCCVIAATASLVHAQPLADRMPGDALVYLGWAGADAAKTSGFDGTHLQAVLAESRVNEIFGSYLDQLELQVVAKEPNAAEPFRLIRALGAPFWKYPSAVVLQRGDDITARKGPPVKLMLLSKVGADAEKVAGEWNDLFANIHGDGQPHVAAVQDMVLMTFGYTGDVMIPSGVDALAGNAAFTEVLGKAGGPKSPLMVAYLDLEGATKMVEEAVAAHAAPRGGGAEGASTSPSEKVKTFLDASGLRAVKHFVCTTGFDGKDWVDSTFVHAPGERTGVLTAWPDGPVDESLLKSVPADASFVSSVRFDPAVFVKQLQASVGKTDPDALKMFNQGLGALQAAAGTNVLQNVLEPLGPDWVFYNSPHVSTSSILGMVLVNKPEDPEKLRRALNAMSVSVANWINVGLDHADMIKRQQSQAGSGGVRAQQIKIGDARITYLTTPIAAPSWAIEDGKFYFGLYPQSVGAAVRQAKKGGPSIVESEKYKAVVARLGGQPGTATFYDLPAAAGYDQMYSSMLVIGRYVGIADLFGPALPEPILPPFDTLLENLAPAGSVGWHDADGWHTKSVMPFPGSTLFMEQGMFFSAGGPGGAALGASIMLPALSKAREQANRVKSMSNLRQIGMGCILYANENNGAFPADFGELIKKEDLVADTFVNPRSGTSIPEDAKSGDKAVEFVQTNADYVYLGTGLSSQHAKPTDIVAYEKPDEMTDGVSILYADGHVEFVMMGPAMQQIDAQKQARGAH